MQSVKEGHNFPGLHRIVYDEELLSFGGSGWIARFIRTIYGGGGNQSIKSDEFIEPMESKESDSKYSLCP